MSLSIPSRAVLRAALVCFLFLLQACASRVETPPIRSWEEHQAAVLRLDDWELAGRLNVRQDGQSDTVTINWTQRGEQFDLNLSGSFGLGAVHIFGTPAEITVEKANESPVTLPGFGALTQEYFGYDFPAAEMLYWVRGIPAPTNGESFEFNEGNQLATLEQADGDNQVWRLAYDRYEPGGGVFLPGRIRVQREGLQLTFLVSEWRLD